MRPYTLVYNVCAPPYHKCYFHGLIVHYPASLLFFIGMLIRMCTIVTTCLMIVVTCCTIVLCATWAVTCTVIILRSIGLYHIEGQCLLHVVSMSQVVKSDIIEYHTHLMIGYNEISSVLLRVLWKAATLVTMIDFFCVCWIIVVHVRNM